MGLTAPKCRLCGTEHWSREPCKLTGKPLAGRPTQDSWQEGKETLLNRRVSGSETILRQRVRELEAEVAAMQLVIEGLQIAAGKGLLAGKANKPANTANASTDRKTYQRELMRKRRAAARAKEAT